MMCYDMRHMRLNACGLVNDVGRGGERRNAMMIYWWDKGTLML